MILRNLFAAAAIAGTLLLPDPAGAQDIDINSGPLSRSPEEKMTFLVHAVQDTVDLPVVLDTANPQAVAAGLAASRHQRCRPDGHTIGAQRQRLGKV